MAWQPIVVWSGSWEVFHHDLLLHRFELPLMNWCVTRFTLLVGSSVAVLAAFICFGTGSAILVAASQDKGDSPGKDDLKPERPAVKLGLQTNSPKAYQGYTLICPMGSKNTYLIDMEGKVVRTWKSETPTALSAYLLENGHLLR